MPPKPLAEDLARKKAERDKQRKAEAALAVLEKPSGFEQAVNAVKDPVGTVKQLGRVAKETFYDPSKRFAAAVDPNSGASVADRIAGVGEGVLYAADFLTPGVPEMAIANSYRRKALGNAALGSPTQPKPSSIDLFELSLPYGKQAAAYEKALIKMLGKHGNPSIPSVRVDTNRLDDLLDFKTFDPIVGRGGLIHSSSPDYREMRNTIEQVTNAPVYGYHRLAGDVDTALGYGYGKTSAIVNVQPDIVKSMSQGDSLDLFTRRGLKAEDLPPDEKVNLFLREFDPDLPAPRPYMVDEDLRETVEQMGLDPRTAAGYGYRELQMGPFRFTPDHVRDVELLRTGEATPQMLAAQRRLAQRMVDQGIPVSTGRQMLLRDVLAKDIAANPQAYTPELLNQLEFQVFVPDRLPLHRLPATHSKFATTKALR